MTAHATPFLGAIAPARKGSVSPLAQRVALATVTDVALAGSLFPCPPPYQWIVPDPGSNCRAIWGSGSVVLSRLLGSRRPDWGA